MRIPNAVIVASTVAVLAVCAVAGAALPARTMAARAGLTHRPITAGYPYAAQCPAAGIADLVDRWRMYACNCTSYVAWALVANGQRIDWFVAGAMDAWNWPNVARRSGLHTGLTPAVGDVAVWPALDRPLGHVAYVTALHADGRFDVAEYNFPSPGGLTRFVFDSRTNLAAGHTVFIAVPKLQAR